MGDSFNLSKAAAGLPTRHLCFAAFHSWGERKPLSPDKTVLMPDAGLDCPMAHMVRREEVEQARRECRFGWSCYINSTAEIKSWADVCVTSANAVQIVKNLPNKNILFIPTESGPL